MTRIIRFANGELTFETTSAVFEEKVGFVDRGTELRLALVGIAFIYLKISGNLEIEKKKFEEKQINLIKTMKKTQENNIKYYKTY